VWFLTPVQERVFYFSGTGTLSELWVTDGSVERTINLIPAAPYAQSSYSMLIPHGRSIYFGYNDGAHGREIWTSDGTRAGTRMVADTWPGRGSGVLTSLNLISPVRSRVYFQAVSGVPGKNLWVLDTCPADFNNDGQITTQDIFDFLGSFFAHEDLADVNHDGEIGLGDILAWIEEYLTGCP
jgi:ELWxxDGT repeat protein